MDILGNDCMVEWYQAARAEDPKAVLYLNDYSILTGGGRDTAHQDHYEKTLKFLIEKGAPLGGIGLQGHFGQDVTAPTKLLQILDRFGRLGLPMHVTEFDVNTTDRDLQAAYTRDFMTVLFSHPQVAGILMWGFWAGQHWKPDAALYDRDWTIRPHGKVWMDLVSKEWWTDAAARTDARGACKVRGFLGEYEVTVEAGGKTKTVRATLAKPGATVTVAMD